MIQKEIEHTEIPLGSYAPSRSTVFLVTLTKKNLPRLLLMLAPFQLSIRVQWKILLSLLGHSTSKIWYNMSISHMLRHRLYLIHTFKLIDMYLWMAQNIRLRKKNRTVRRLVNRVKESIKFQKSIFMRISEYIFYYLFQSKWLMKQISNQDI